MAQLNTFMAETICSDTGLLAKDGQCATHGGDACLVATSERDSKVYRDRAALEAQVERLRAAWEHMIERARSNQWEKLDVALRKAEKILNQNEDGGGR